MEKKWMDSVWLKLDSHTKTSFHTVKRHSGEKITWLNVSTMMTKSAMGQI